MKFVFFMSTGILEKTITYGLENLSFAKVDDLLRGSSLLYAICFTVPISKQNYQNISLGFMPNRDHQAEFECFKALHVY